MKFQMSKLTISFWVNVSKPLLRYHKQSLKGSHFTLSVINLSKAMMWCLSNTVYTLRNCPSFLSWILLMFMRSFFSRKLKVKTRRSIPCVALFWVNSWRFVSATITQTHTLQHFSVKDTCYARCFSALDALCNWLLIILLRNTGVSLMF